MPRPRLRAAAAAATVALSGAMVAIKLPDAPLPEGYVTPILAFEFVRQPEALAFLAVPGMAEKLTHTLYADMAFPFAYGGLLALSLSARLPRPLRWLGAGAALAAIPLDLAENIVMLNIIHDFEPPAVTIHLAWLWPVTWLKWGSIAIAAAVLAAGAKSPLQWLCAGLGVLTAVLIATTWATGAPGNIAEGMFGAISLFFLSLVIDSFWSLRRKD